MNSNSGFTTSVRWENKTNTALCFLAGKAQEHDILNQLQLPIERVERLLKAYQEHLKLKRYRVKSKLIDNYLKLH